MTIDIKTINVEPRRHTFGHIARRLGDDKPASRYDEATMDLQPTDNFHYKPLWEPEYWTYDKAKTALKMEDWYALRDPRQYYYATYNIARANMQQSVERNFGFVEKRGMLDQMDADWRALVADYLLPMRHVAWGANMNMAAVCDRGYGTALTAPSIFTAADQLGMAQILSRIGLMMDGSTGASLDAAKATWMEAPYWQGIRKAVEDSLVLKDPMELYTAQTLAFDGILHRLVYDRFDAAGQKHGAAGLSMLTEFMVEWRTDHEKWVDAVLKVAAAESAENKALLSGWAKSWIDTVAEAARPLAAHVLGDNSGGVVDEIRAEMAARCAKIGLTV